VKITVHGAEYPVQVSEQGVFSTTVAGTLHEAQTLAALGHQVRAQLGVKVEVPFTVNDRGVIRHGVCVGSGRDGNILVRWDDDPAHRTELISWHHTTLARLDEQDEERYRNLCAAHRMAAVLLDQFERAHAIDLRHQITAAAESAREEDR